VLYSHQLSKYLTFVYLNSNEISYIVRVFTRRIYVYTLIKKKELYTWFVSQPFSIPLYQP